MIRILLADDHLLLLEGLARALGSLPDMEVIGMATDGSQLLEMVSQDRPDVMLVDLDMPRLGGIDALRRIPDLPPALVVTMHVAPARRAEAREAGAVGFLSKATPLPDLAAAVRAAAAGEDLLEAPDLPSLLEPYREITLDEGAARLTHREREVLSLLASGVSRTEELSIRLYISKKTVKNHLASIYQKLAVADRAQAAVEAIRLGLSGK